MIRTVGAVIDEHGEVRLMETVRLPAARRALVTATGRSVAGGLLTVSYAVRADDTRIISAWSATSEERRHYYEQGDN